MPTTAEALTKRPDFYLVEEIFELVNGWDPEYPPEGWTGSCVMDLDPELADLLSFLLTEAVERFAPNVELQLAQHVICESNCLEGGRRAALDQYVTGAGQRHAMRLSARAVLQRQGSGDLA